MIDPGAPIPGATPLDDLSGLRDRAIRTRSQLNAAEAMNIRRAAVKYLAGRPSRRAARFDAPWLCRLHREMFGEVWSWAGVIRTRELNLGSHSRDINVHLHSMLADLQAWEEHAMPRDEQAARLHHRAVAIHPFLNGNGRWARMLANIWLRMRGDPIVEWPETTIGDTSIIRDKYLAAIRAADKGEYQSLIELHRRHTPRN